MRRETWFPVELSVDLPCVTMKGRDSVRIEQHKGLIAYQEDMIIFRTGCGQMRVQGRELCFRQYSGQDAEIIGKISGIFMEGNVS